MSQPDSVGDRYVLATGDTGEQRLALLNRVYGPTTQAFLNRLPIAESSRAVDFGCGTGNVSLLIAKAVGSNGHVTGVDASQPQVELAAHNARESGLANTSFVVGSVYETGLPAHSFDLAYGRLILCHLQRPEDMIREMKRLLKPGGILACEELDIATMSSDPPTSAYLQIKDLSLRLGQVRGVDYGMGAKLFSTFGKCGLHAHVSVVQPAYAVGAEKRVWEYTFLEAAPNMIAENILDSIAVDTLKTELDIVANDPNILVFQPRFVQAWARVPA